MVAWILVSLKCPCIPLPIPLPGTHRGSLGPMVPAKDHWSMADSVACVMVAPSPPSLYSLVNSHVLFNFLFSLHLLIPAQLDQKKIITNFF